MIKLGLLGKNLAHSKSKLVYESLLNQELDYKFFDYSDEKSIPSLNEIFLSVQGLSITSPYKKHFFQQTQKSSEIELLGAINCIKKVGDYYEGTNTDFLALVEIFNELPISKFSKIIILGDGAMANVTSSILHQVNVVFDQYSRKMTKDFSKLNLGSIYSGIKNCLVINSCSREFIYQEALPEGTFFLDYNYNHAHSQIIPSNQVQYQDGFDLLMRQGKHAIKFWAIK
jgi:shikimate dehydrogenase